MLLAIDAGNTNIVFALVDGREIRARWRIATEGRRTADEYAVWLVQLMAIGGFTREEIDSVVICTVVPRTLHNLEVLSAKYFGVKALIAGTPPLDWGIDIDVISPETVGADRLVNALAAHHLHSGHKIAIDFGTATTFDWVDEKGAYRGGIIAPGINLSLDALVGKAARLPRIAIEIPKTDSVIGRSTEESMHSGIYWGYIAMIEGLTERMKQEIGQPVTVIATGGLASLFAVHTSVFDVIEPDLTIRGMALLYEQKAPTKFTAHSGGFAADFSPL
ncbi:Baf family transcriptional acitvator [Zymomonas mobilis subsp. mobilis ZM4 = ATCC 31821]|uniref:Type III pantothenate kinase n=3 Tax=Zymomonas mobilis TaxID=542 RepID=COAX_ZYMMO|nr:type III pantothenate kinase [Zymomonas mobilis]Q5NLB9.1 RecName: Full=Type III pantothenate kinase; AltName: Full=PanK-III; AltName: Full=Pantothenic acid kinase [Zymomonas mobilis subsp. mobilis ZM4 = ATCC 31821]AAV90491.1 putative transcriptional acitvator, Baf family [Zymomonas mobilis subsp. mobilis ZM4 = ATCC 31821]ACV75816.1 putative transcriptional acitvator, Baf family [Zymomonas mobilis subsp. mobilis NCIMB 11163]AEH63123.1 transcriptional activator, Baf family [Zymomonas mobilis s